MARVRHAYAGTIPRAGRQGKARYACDRAQWYVIEFRQYLALIPRAITGLALRVLALPLPALPTLLSDRRATLAVRLRVAARIVAGERLKAERLAGMFDRA